MVCPARLGAAAAAPSGGSEGSDPRSVLRQRPAGHRPRLARAHLVAARGDRLRLAAVVGVLLGAVIGQSVWAMRGLDPIFQVLRTVPPLAWLPISLAAFRDSQPVGDLRDLHHRHLADHHQHGGRHPQHPAGLSQRRARAAAQPDRVLLQDHDAGGAPYIFTGLRIGIGLSWLAIVAAEMLTGGVGIGFFIWDAWNSSLIRHHRRARLHRLVGFVLDRLVAASSATIVTRGTAQLRRTMKHGHDPISSSIRHRQILQPAAAAATEVLRDINLSPSRRASSSRSSAIPAAASRPAQPDRRPDAGDAGGVLLENREVNAPGPDRAVVFQNHSLLPWLTVYDNVRWRSTRCFGHQVARRAARLDHAQSRSRADGPCQGQAPGEISGGMKQRVGIARALAMEPKVLLLDEPFGALDALTRAHLQDSGDGDPRALGNTMIMITHDVDEAVLLSDRIVMMTNGPARRSARSWTCRCRAAAQAARTRDRPHLPQMPRGAC
jgi:nitrate/nitrite transport system ATP-binding protein